MTGVISKIMKMDGNIFSRIDGVMIIGMFGGVIAAAFWGNNVRWRMPASRIRIYQALIGGIIAGFGARLGMGCNLASLFTGIPQFSASCMVLYFCNDFWCLSWCKSHSASIFSNKS